MDMEHIEFELCEMKAATLGTLGKKVEIAIHMLHIEERKNKRLKKMVVRAAQKSDAVKGWFKINKYKPCIERIEKRIGRSNAKVRSLKDLKEKYVAAYKEQREILGMYDHSFIDEFYKNLD